LFPTSCTPFSRMSPLISSGQAYQPGRFVKIPSSVLSQLYGFCDEYNDMKRVVHLYLSVVCVYNSTNFYYNVHIYLLTSVKRDIA